MSFFGLLNFAQENVPFDPLHEPNSFRSKNNPYYWKNKKPFTDYWQQDVHYRIKANVDETKHMIDGEEKLTYWNNSPDTLREVFFHLYQNAFVPGSHYENLFNNNEGLKARFGYHQMDTLGTEITSVKVDGKDVRKELDNTILKVTLPKPLLPGKSVEFDIAFKTYWGFGNMRRRMKMFPVKVRLERQGVAYEQTFYHFDGVHWYPRISVYDRKFNWTTDQHLDKEFYGDFGTFDVELTFAENYIVDATGNLVNRDEMLPAELRQKLDVKNFKDKPWGETANEIIPYDGQKRKTWKFHAENVHDFAFTADPTYRIGEVDTNGVVCRSLVQEPHASGWQNAAEYTAKVIGVYSNDFGKYAYHKMIVADASDGMEYPMLTLDGGRDPSYRRLLAHEVGHNWFFGMVGTNETYRAAMDEGFTQFLTAWSTTKIDGDTIASNQPKNKYRAHFKKPLKTMGRNIYDSYIASAHKKTYDLPLNTHSNDFHGEIRHGGGYSQVYYTPSAMLYNLEYVLGEDLFQKAMKNYFNEWSFCHPYFEDFRSSFIRYTKVDLNWFFDQWWTTNKVIDYAVKSVRKGDKQDEYIITFKRKGEMQMPIEFEVVSKDSTRYAYYIPNTWFTKDTKAEVLPKWYGWGEKLHPEYEARVVIPGGIENVIIDPTHRLADADMRDNSKKFPYTVTFDSKISNRPDWKHYEFEWGPNLWFNDYDGLKVGLHLNGDYLDYSGIFRLDAWYNTGVGQGGYNQTEFPLGQTSAYDKFNYRFDYSTPLDQVSRHLRFNLNARTLDGLDQYIVGFEKRFNDKNKVDIFFKSMYRATPVELNYLLYPDEWIAGQFNNSINTRYTHSYRYYRGLGEFTVGLRSSTIGGDYDYAYLELEAENMNRLGKFLINTRLYGRYGTGSAFPRESALFLAGGNPESMMDNAFVRSKGFVPDNWTGYDVSTNHFHYGGGLNLRGYAGYTAVHEDETDSLHFIYRGKSGAAVNVEIEFDELVRIRPKWTRKWLKLDTYLFGDAGTITYDDDSRAGALTDIRMDAGIGAAFTIKKLWTLDEWEPLTFRIDVPFVVSHTPFVDPDFVALRWVVGVERAF